MDIADLLKIDVPNSIRVSCGDYWIYFDNQSQMWVVREHVRYQRSARVLIETANEEEAVAVFVKALDLNDVEAR